MANTDDTSNQRRKPRNQPTPPAVEQSAEATPVATAAESPGQSVSAKEPLTLKEVIEHERSLLLEIRAMLHCLHEVLLYAEDDDTVLHAEVAQTASRLINESVARLDWVNLKPLVDALRPYPKLKQSPIFVRESAPPFYYS